MLKSQLPVLLAAMLILGAAFTAADTSAYVEEGFIKALNAPQ